MSRSHRKTPIFGHTGARSEAVDKRLWHQRWRARERDQLAVLGVGDNPLPVQRQRVSNTWEMSKDGKSWLDPQRQRELAAMLAAGRSRSAAERTALYARLLARWQAK